MKENNLPIIVFYTAVQCGHCKTFRGTDGRPNKSREWNYDRIRNYLISIDENNELKQRSSCILEIHIDQGRPNYNNISELNIYTSIPSENDISNVVREKKIDSLTFFEKTDFISNSIERVNIKRGMFDKIEIRTEITDTSTNYSRHMNIFNFNEYVWGKAPIQVSVIRTCIFKKMDVPDGLLESIDDRRLAKLLSDNYVVNQNDLKKFDKVLLEEYFTFSWLMSKLIVPGIKRYELFYPCWMIVSPYEWGKSIEDEKHQLYARVRNHVTRKRNGRYVPSSFSQSETIDHMLDSYHSGDLSLHYDPANDIVKRHSWQF